MNDLEELARKIVKHFGYDREYPEDYSSLSLMEEIREALASLEGDKLKGGRNDGI